jgi:hypothetical protein
MDWTKFTIHVPPVLDINLFQHSVVLFQYCYSKISLSLRQGFSLEARKENHKFILEFSGLYHLKEVRKPKYSEKTPDDLFISRLIPV